MLLGSSIGSELTEERTARPTPLTFGAPGRTEESDGTDLANTSVFTAQLSLPGHWVE